MYAKPYDAEGHQTAGEPLNEAEVIERAPDERVGRSDELRDLDLGALGQDLQPNGVEHDRNQARGEQGTQ